MLGTRIQSFLRILYPALVLTAVLLIWSSSNLAEVVALTPPPINDGFNYFWNPAFYSRTSCEPKRDPKLYFKSTCSSELNKNH